MPCTHKFFGHMSHLAGDFGLIPAWQIDTFIIGTFNPEIIWHPDNVANYYYGRPINYLWEILPKFAGEPSILHNDINTQIDFLQVKRIGLTDLLVRIGDAELGNPEHETRIQTLQDKKIELFENFEWNTPFIQDYIVQNNIQAVYFSKLGNPNAVNINPQSFEAQMRAIEQSCQILNIPTYRLHTPSGMGLGADIPREHNLIQRWFNENGGNQFPFLSDNFDIANYPIL